MSAGISYYSLSSRMDSSYDAAHNAHQSNAAIAKVGELRDPGRLRSDYLNDNLSRLQDLLNGGEAQLKVMLSNPHMMMVIGNLPDVDFNVPNAIEQIQDQMQRAAHFLSNIEGGFAVYVDEKEAAAQEKLNQVADIEGKDPQLVEAELLSAGRIPERLNIDEVGLNLSTNELTGIARTLLGDGSQQSPGSPSLFREFINGLRASGRIEELDLGENLEKLSSLMDNVSPDTNGFPDNEAVKALREHFNVTLPSKGMLTKSAFKKV